MTTPAKALDVFVVTGKRIGDLRRALNKLDHEQGRITRRNARARVARVLKAIQAAVDREFPPIRKPIVVKKKRSKNAKMRPGYVRIRFVRHIAQLAELGIPVRQIVSDDVPGTPKAASAPQWALGALLANGSIGGDISPTLIRKLKKSRNKQRAILALLALPDCWTNPEIQAQAKSIIMTEV